MEREIVIRLRVPRSTKRQRFVAIVAAAVLGSAALVYAAVPNVFTAGDPLSASKLNDNFSSLQGQITPSNLGTRVPSAFHATLTVSATTTAGQAVHFDQVDFDIAGEYNKVTAAFVAKNAGIYLITCSVFFLAGGTPGTYQIEVRKNGNQLIVNEIQSSNTTIDSGALTPSLAATAQLAAGDTLQCFGFLVGSPATLHAGSVPLNTFSVARLY